MKPTDVLVAGNGMAGLVAALAAAARGKSVRVAARGAGALTISGGCVDLLGYVCGQPVRGNPLDAIASLPETHPYRQIGAERVREALDFFLAVCRENGLTLENPVMENLWVPTILGTFRPSFLCPPGSDREVLARAEVLLIPKFSWLKDCHAGMIRTVLETQRRLKNKIFATPPLTPPQGPTHRNLTPLDVARLLDGPAGEAWLRRELKVHTEAVAGKRVAVLLPPVLGVKNSTAVRGRLEETLGCSLIEMACPPPGVGGMRIKEALMAALRKAGIDLIENVDLTEARVEGGRCLSLICDAPDRRRELVADSFIIATGGFFGGGNLASPGMAREAIFNLDLGAPLSVEEWSRPEVFEPQPYATLGVRVNESLQPISPEGTPLLDNVFFAGRTLGGYDFVLEKCGHGVALASGYHAAQLC